MSQPAKTFGRYRLIRKIAQGGMAEIFLAKFRGAGGFEKKVIIKRILPRFSQNQEFIKMLVHEAKLAVQLHHANVVQIYDLGRVRDSYFISMEYIKGKDLRTVTNRLVERGEKMPQQIAVFIAREMCKGLEYAHSIVNDDGLSLDLVHRDISPPNILLSLDGEVKIIDFGIAKATAKATDTQAGVFKGKFAYMSPEQAAGKRIDRRTDIFATGLVLYEMLTNVKLLDADTDMATLERARSIDNVELALAQAGVPAELERITRRALRGEVEQRYQTAGEMARELTIFLNTRYPTFTEADISSFMRKLFNLDRRAIREDDTDPSLIPSLTGSLELEDDRPPSMRTTQNLSMRTTQNLGAAVASLAAVEEDGDSGLWALEEELEADLGADFEVRGGGAAAGADGQLALASSPNPGWVSQVAAGWRSDEPMPRARPQVSHTDALAAAADASVDHTLQASRPLPARGAGQRRGARSWVAAVLTLALVCGAALGALVGVPVRQAAELPAGMLLARHSIRSALKLPTLAIVPITVRPGEAEIRVDGAAVGRGEADLLLATGVEHVIEARQEGYAPGSWKVNGPYDGVRMPLDLTLAEVQRPTGRLLVTSEPPGARIAVDGVAREGLVTPAEIGDLPVDQPVRISLLLDGYVAQEVTLTATEEGAPVVAALEPKPVALSVMSSPEGATVSVDDRMLEGRTPMEGLLLLPEATYQIKVSLDGYVAHEETLSTRLGQDVNLRVSLAPVSAEAPASAEAPVAAPPVAVSAQPPRNPGGRRPKATEPAAQSDPASREAAQSEVRALLAAAAQQIPPPPERARVNVVVLPDGLRTQVYLNEELLGDAPIRDRRLEPGEYTLRLKSAEANLDRAWQKVILAEDAGKTLNWEFEIAAPAP